MRRLVGIPVIVAMALGGASNLTVYGPTASRSPRTAEDRVVQPAGNLAIAPSTSSVDSASAPLARRARATGPGVRPEAPAALAVGPDGALYLVDTEREQILRYLPRTGFRVVAGDGKAGSSPDGTPALHARLDLGWWSGLAIAKNGIVYFTEGGRVREIRANGTITAVAGGGRTTLTRRPVPALEANLSARGDGLAGLAFGPGDELYVGTATGVYRLGPGGKLYWVVGDPFAAPPPHWGGVYTDPAIQNDFADAVHLAFDARGNLFVSGGGAFGLYERTATGQLRFVEALRAQGGAPGALATAPNGTVIAVSGTWGLQRIGPSGRAVTIRAAWPKIHGPRRLPFCPCFGNGVAAGARGQIYVDTDHGDAVPNQGLLEELPSGRVRWLWEAPG